jgi:hypothetical protein
MAWRLRRLRSGLLLSSVLWVACDLNPQPVVPGSISADPMMPGSGASMSAGSAGTGSGGTVIVASGGSTSTGGSSVETPVYPDAGVDPEDEVEAGGGGAAGNEGGGSGAPANGTAGDAGAAGETATGGNGG